MTEAGLKAACPEYSQYFGTSADGLDDCAIRQLAVGAPQPTATCCAAASDFVASGSCGQNEIVSEFPPLLLSHPYTVSEFPPLLLSHSHTVSEFPPLLLSHPYTVSEFPPLLPLGCWNR